MRLTDDTSKTSRRQRAGTLGVSGRKRATKLALLQHRLAAKFNMGAVVLGQIVEPGLLCPGLTRLQRTLASLFLGVLASITRRRACSKSLRAAAGSLGVDAEAWAPCRMYVGCRILGRSRIPVSRDPGSNDGGGVTGDDVRLAATMSD